MHFAITISHSITQRLQQGVGSWALNNAALAELASTGEPLSVFLPSAVEEDKSSTHTAVCLEAKS